MDKRVYITFGGTIFLFVILLIANLLEEKPCQGLNYTIPSQVMVGKQITFSVDTEMAKSWHWDFGDTAESDDPIAVHTYDEPGLYEVELIINDQCKVSEKIEVLEVEDSTKLIVANIEGPNTVNVNEMVSFTVEGNDIYAYEWLFGESGDIDSREPNPNYTYREPGQYTVTLYVNGQNNPVKHSIRVFPKVPPSVPTISETKFKNMLQAREDYNQFRPYICYNENVKVTTSENETLTFYAYCSRLKIMTNININSVQLTRKSNNCIVAIRVNQTLN